VTGLSLAASTAQLIFNDNRKPSDCVRFTGSVLITVSAAIPYAGPFISFGLGTADAAEAFESFYKSPTGASVRLCLVTLIKLARKA